MVEMKSLLLSKLQEPGRSVEEQEKTIEYAAYCFKTSDRSLIVRKDSNRVEHARRPDMDLFRQPTYSRYEADQYIISFWCRSHQQWVHSLVIWRY